MIGDIIRDYRTGASIRQLQTRYGLGWRTVSAILYAAGVPVRKRGRPQGAVEVSRAKRVWCEEQQRWCVMHDVGECGACRSRLEQLASARSGFDALYDVEGI